MRDIRAQRTREVQRKSVAKTAAPASGLLPRMQEIRKNFEARAGAQECPPHTGSVELRSIGHPRTAVPTE